MEESIASLEDGHFISGFEFIHVQDGATLVIRQELTAQKKELKIAAPKKERLSAAKIFKKTGFVINRIKTTAEVNALPNPVEGMMVYDVEADCLKIYTSKDGGSTFGWHCFTTQTCPD